MFKNLTSKIKSNNKLIIVIALVLIACFGLGATVFDDRLSRLFDTNNYDYQFNYVDSSDGSSQSYLIKIDTKTKALLVEVAYSGSAVDSERSIDIYGPTTLTDLEFDNILTAIDNYRKSDNSESYYERYIEGSSIARALESIARDDEPFYAGYPTYRSYGNSKLDSLLLSDKENITE